MLLLKMLQQGLAIGLQAGPPDVGHASGLRGQRLQEGPQIQKGGGSAEGGDAGASAGHHRIAKPWAAFEYFPVGVEVPGEVAQLLQQGLIVAVPGGTVAEPQEAPDSGGDDRGSGGGPDGVP